MKASQIANLTKEEAQARVVELEHALQLHLDFLASLPHGWLGKTTGDVGLLNEAYGESQRLGMKVR